MRLNFVSTVFQQVFGSFLLFLTMFRLILTNSTSLAWNYLVVFFNILATFRQCLELFSSIISLCNKVDKINILFILRVGIINNTLVRLGLQILPQILEIIAYIGSRLEKIYLIVKL